VVRRSPVERWHHDYFYVDRIMKCYNKTISFKIVPDKEKKLDCPPSIEAVREGSSRSRRTV